MENELFRNVLQNYLPKINISVAVVKDNARSAKLKNILTTPAAYFFHDNHIGTRELVNHIATLKPQLLYFELQDNTEIQQCLEVIVKHKLKNPYIVIQLPVTHTHPDFIDDSDSKHGQTVLDLIENMEASKYSLVNSFRGCFFFMSTHIYNLQKPFIIQRHMHKAGGTTIRTLIKQNGYNLTHEKVIREKFGTVTDANFMKYVQSLGNLSNKCVELESDSYAVNIHNIPLAVKWHDIINFREPYIRYVSHVKHDLRHVFRLKLFNSASVFTNTLLHTNLYAVTLNGLHPNAILMRIFEKTPQLKNLRGMQKKNPNLNKLRKLLFDKYMEFWQDNKEVFKKKAIRHINNTKTVIVIDQPLRNYPRLKQHLGWNKTYGVFGKSTFSQEHFLNHANQLNVQLLPKKEFDKLNELDHEIYNYVFSKWAR